MRKLLKSLDVATLVKLNGFTVRSPMITNQSGCCPPTVAASGSGDKPA